MLADGKSRRINERRPSALWVRILCRETNESSWEELSHVNDISISGACFSTINSLIVGQLLQLTLPMPRELRLYDHQLPEYQIWAVVRSIKPSAKRTLGLPRMEVGVAFAGREPPASFQLDPTTLYDLLPTPTRQGTWQLRQRPRRADF